jgi:hypothetical protein
MDGITIQQTGRTVSFAASGGSITIRSTHAPDLLRGEGLDYVVLDEAAYMEARIWQDIVRPMLVDQQGGAIFLSTPRGRNWFWEVYQLGMDPTQHDWIAFHFPTAANPLIARDELETIRRSTPERVFREEYLAEFIDDAGQVFRDLIPQVPAGAIQAPRSGHRYVLGVDWGREQDYTAVIVLDVEGQQVVALDRFRDLKWSFQQERIAQLARHWGNAVIWAESNSMGTANIEALQQLDVTVYSFATTAHSKPPLIENLALAIERGDLRLLDDPVLLNELASYSIQRLPGGGFRYSAPAGMHDDTVMALAIAWHGSRSGKLSIDFF